MDWVLVIWLVSSVSGTTAPTTIFDFIDEKSCQMALTAWKLSDEVYTNRTPVWREGVCLSRSRASSRPE